MAIKWDSDANRYYIKLKETNKTKIYVDDKRSKKIYKPSSRYLKALETLLKKRSPANDRKVFSSINDKTVADSQVGGLLSKYNFTESDKFNKLYNASINFIKHWKSKMIFEVNDVKKALNSSVFEANLTPTKMPEHDDPTAILKDYFNTAMRTFFKFLRETGHNNPREFKYIVEAHNNEDPNRTRKFTVSMVLKDWGKETIQLILDRIEQFIQSSQLQNLKDLSLLMKCYPSVSGGANSESFNKAVYEKHSIIKMTNDGNECLWWCLTILLNQNSAIYKTLKDLRYTKTLGNMAKQLCESCGYDYSNKVDIEDLPDIINKVCQASQKPSFNIAVLDIEHLPAFSSTIDINPSIMYQTDFKTDEYYYLLFDINHFSPILDIKKFLNVRAFCHKCQTAFVNTKSFTEHECDENKEEEHCGECENSEDECSDDDHGENAVCSNKKVNDKVPLTLNRVAQLKREIKANLRKDRKLFVGSQYDKLKQLKRNDGDFRYIIWDIEVNQEPDDDGFKTHKPNLIVAFEIVIKHGLIKDVEAFVDNLKPIVFEGYDCVERYCEWVMSEESNIKQRKQSKGYKTQSV